MAEDAMIYLETLLRHLPEDLRDEDRDLIERAYRRASEAHAGQLRRSGQPYVVHCVAVAQILADMKLDAVTIAAALLHDTIEDTDLTLLDLDVEFGGEVAVLVDGVTKLESIPRVKDGKLVEMAKRLPERESEFLRKTFIAMGQDVRVIIIKLADRLDNMRTLHFLSKRRQRAISEETLDIFAPLAHRLGIWKMKCELEDLSFRYLQPERYREVRDVLDQHQENAEAYLYRVARRIERQLAEVKVPAKVMLGQRHVYDIYRRMRTKRIPLEHLHDLRPVRVIVEDKLSCYVALGVVHSIWRPVDGAFDDYISRPKDNFYKSLHTDIISRDKRTLTIQIRTQEMHEHAEYGIVAHWRYWNGVDGDESFERRIQYLRGLMDVGSDLEDSDEYIDALRSDVFQDRVYVFSPKGDTIDLPVGATPIDFAYYIHTEIGHRCRGARVNGKLVGLDYNLQSGDKVEIITASRGGPSVDWLNPNLGYVSTKRALTKIRQWFRRQDREKAVALGHEVIARELRRLGMSHLNHDDVAALFYSPPDDFFAAVGSGDMDGHQVAIRILEAERGQRAEDAAPRRAPRLAHVSRDVIGLGGRAAHRAQCCDPQDGDPIIGYESSDGSEVIIHRADCPETAELEQSRQVNVSWAAPENGVYRVPVVITAYDREGLMRDIGAVVANERVNMSDVHISTSNNIATFDVVMEIADYAQLSRTLAKIEQLTNVVEAHRSITPQVAAVRARSDTNS
ncbi:MAG: bifunctional (p)ppGpp synthetase/guanosine-3',5'-bis(diphosphate) 3'-pyrophosphohydrolase [Anaerolineae bacterium]|nr:bifunctional (p)ppGpp synthetase/guanosine-3',5'-bis(diphosphate) 3'-pyrophosphohydrolase [Anaerolineae bacterium]